MNLTVFLQLKKLHEDIEDILFDNTYGNNLEYIICNLHEKKDSYTKCVKFKTMNQCIIRLIYGKNVDSEEQISISLKTLVLEKEVQ